MLYLKFSVIPILKFLYHALSTLHNEFKTFVQKRIDEIRSNVQLNIWHYCPTTQNPAEIITRVNISNLTNGNFPSFLYDGVVTEGIK